MTNSYRLYSGKREVWVQFQNESHFGEYKEFIRKVAIENSGYFDLKVCFRETRNVVFHGMLNEYAISILLITLQRDVKVIGADIEEIKSIGIANSKESFDRLSCEQQDLITRWITKNLSVIKSINKRHTSYGLKHKMQHSTGIYCTNGEFKGAMLSAGFRTDNKYALNWSFNVSERSVQKC